MKARDEGSVVKRIEDTTKTNQSRDDIKIALLDLLRTKPLSDITMTQLAQNASVSRSTLYNHFNNVAEVYTSLVGDFRGTISPLEQQLDGENPAESPTKPFCLRIMEKSPWQPLFNEQMFMDTLLNDPRYLQTHDLYNLLKEQGYSDEIARSLSIFQIAGCYMAARAAATEGKDWKKIRPIIDRFIVGGIKECVS